MCERKEKRARLSTIRGGVKEVSYCPREISFKKIVLLLTYDTIYQLCYFGIIWSELIALLSLSQPPQKKCPPW